MHAQHRACADAPRASADAPRACVDAPRAYADAPRACADAPRGPARPRQMAYMVEAGLAHGVITEDSDLVPYGTARIFFKMDKNGHGEQLRYEQLPNNRAITLARRTPKPAKPETRNLKPKTQPTGGLPQVFAGFRGFSRVPPGLHGVLAGFRGCSRCPIPARRRMAHSLSPADHFFSTGSI